MDAKIYCLRLRRLIGADELEKVFRELSQLLKNSPKLDAAILQSARWNDLKRQIQLGLLSYEQSEVTKNRIRTGLLELVGEMERKSADPAIDEEVTGFAHSITGKNVVSGSTIRAGGNVSIGDQIQQFTESPISRKIRFFLFVLVPLLAIATAVLYYRYQLLQLPLLLTVSLDNRTPNQELDKDLKGGKAILQYGGKADTLNIINEATFKGIPANYRGEAVRLKIQAAGFLPVDTSFALKKDAMTLPVYRDDTYAQLDGIVTDESGNPIAGAIIAAQDISGQTDAQGRFALYIPLDRQRKQQRLSVTKPGFKPWDRTEPVLKNELTRVQLIKKWQP